MNKLAKKINLYVFIKRTIISLFVYAFLVIVLLIPAQEYDEIILRYILTGVASFLTLLALIYNFILPFYVYKKHGYLISEEEIVIETGVLFRQQVNVPIKRIQHIEKRQGPIQILMKQATVVIVTAGSLTNIIGLENEQANEVVASIQEKLNSYLNLDEKLKDE